MKSDEFGVELGDYIEDTLDFMNSWSVHFKQYTILHGRVITRFGVPKICILLDLLEEKDWINLFLQGNMCRWEVNAPLQRIWASMATEDAKTIALRASHLASTNQFYIFYGLENSGLEEENVCLKADLALDHKDLFAEKSTDC
ncbi:hypothetical protein RDI58_001073 [Solanum bulbocastanum]|uniref:Uncharacterized protein n=1 Tax=Solanum bulbocastanum TaxID=147425 RepID=A0AAN8U4E1_SOLBU